jgi:hypothetical protein
VAAGDCDGARRVNARRSVTRLLRTTTSISGASSLQDPKDPSVITAMKMPKMAGPPPEVPAA